jgi:hypothetical protein
MAERAWRLLGTDAAVVAMRSHLSSIQGLNFFLTEIGHE